MFFGVEDNYLYELARLWPASAILQSTLLLIVWGHGCIGVHFWLRLYRPYRAAQPALLFIAIALPLAALGGFMVSGRTVASSIENAQTFAKVKELTHWPNAADSASLEHYRWVVRFGFAGVLLFVALCIAVRYLLLSMGPKNAITYPAARPCRRPSGRRCSRSAARTRSRMRRCAVGVPAARPAACASSGRGRSHTPRLSRKPSRSPASAPRATCVSPARSGPPAP